MQSCREMVEPGTREKLLEAAFRRLEIDGPEALKARTLTAEIGASTMAVYTHFGGMPGLIEELVRVGLGRFAAHTRGRAKVDDDPLADLIAGGLAYTEFALQNSQLYRLIFGLSGSAGLREAAPSLDAAAIWRSPEGVDAFSVLLESVERVIEAGEIRKQDARLAAIQVLSGTHGFVLLAIGGFEEQEMQRVAVPLSVDLMVGLGADRARTERAMARAFEAAAQGTPGAKESA